MIAILRAMDTLRIKCEDLEREVCTPVHLSKLLQYVQPPPIALPLDHGLEGTTLRTEERILPVLTSKGC